jgi:hypothetical protein
VQHVKEFHYKIETSWSLSVYSGTDVQNKQIIKSRTSSTTLITQNKDSCLHKHNNFPPQELSLTWLLQQIDTENLTAQFKVDTEDEKTKTAVFTNTTTSPLRNFRSLGFFSRLIPRISLHNSKLILKTQKQRHRVETKLLRVQWTSQNNCISGQIPSSPSLSMPS